MVTRILFLLVLFFTSAAAFPQDPVLSFIVTEKEGGKPIVGATVKLINGNGATVAYSITRSGGIAAIEFSAGTGSRIFFEITHVNYERYADSLLISNLENKPVAVQMVKSLKELPRVTIKTDINIRPEKDTIEMATAAAKTVNVNRVGEMLQNIEGFRQESDGKLTYKGQAVTHILVDGTDYSKSDYGSILSGVSASIIDSIQILKHYSENPLLRGKKSSTGLAVNLKIDKKAKLKATYSALAGASNRRQANAGLNVFVPSKKKVFFNAEAGTNTDPSASAITADPPFDVHSAFYTNNYDEVLLPAPKIYYPSVANISVRNSPGARLFLMGGLRNTPGRPLTYNLEFSRREPRYNSAIFSLVNFDSLRLSQNNLKNEMLKRSQIRLLLNNTFVSNSQAKPIAITSSLKLAFNEHTGYQVNDFSGSYQYNGQEKTGRSTWTVLQSNVLAYRGRNGNTKSFTFFGQYTGLSSGINTTASIAGKSVQQNIDGMLLTFGADFVTPLNRKGLSHLSFRANSNQYRLSGDANSFYTQHVHSNTVRRYLGAGLPVNFKIGRVNFSSNVEPGIYNVASTFVPGGKLTAEGRYKYRHWNSESKILLERGILDLDKYVSAQLYTGQQRFTSGLNSVKPKDLISLGQRIGFSDLLRGLDLASGFSYEWSKNDLVYEPEFFNNFTRLIVRQAQSSKTYKADAELKFLIFPLKLKIRSNINLLWNHAVRDSSAMQMAMVKPAISFIRGWKNFILEAFYELNYSKLSVSAMKPIYQALHQYGAKLRIDTRSVFFGLSANIFGQAGYTNPVLDCSFATKLSKKVKLDLSVANLFNKHAFITKRTLAFSDQTYYQPLNGIVIYPKLVFNF